MAFNHILSAVLFLACSNILESNAADIDERILNGQQAKQGQFPYQALLVMSNATGSKSFCGGSLISNNRVLTAAHCCSGFVTTNVWLGMVDVSQASDPNSGVQKLVVPGEDFVIHPDYNPKTFVNDICILKLPSDVEFNANINAVGLPKTKDMNPSMYDFRYATISGFGQTSDTEGLHPQLMYTTVLLQPHIICSSFYFLINQVSNSQLCSGKLLRHAGPCHGDSGGPLTIRDSQGTIIEIGLVSWSILTCQSIFPIVYTYIPAYIDWINENMA